MDFDQMFETWRAQNTEPPYNVNQDALRHALHAEQDRLHATLRTRRRGIWIAGIVAAAMAIWAGFWIAITISNGWAGLYVITSALSLCLLAFGAGALWLSRGREPEPNYGNTLQEEVRRNLVLIDHQLSLTDHWALWGTACIVVGTLLLSWTVNRSQDIPDATFGGWFPILLLLFFAWVLYKSREERRAARAKLETRQRRLGELLASLGANE